MSLVRKFKNEFHEYYCEGDLSDFREAFKKKLETRELDFTVDIRGTFLEGDNFEVYYKGRRFSGNCIYGRVVKQGENCKVSFEVTCSVRVLGFSIVCFIIGCVFFIFLAQVGVGGALVTLLFTVLLPWAMINFNQLLKNDIRESFVSLMKLKSGTPDSAF